MGREYHFIEGSYHNLSFNKNFYKKQIKIDNAHMIYWRSQCEDPKKPCVYCCDMLIEQKEDLCSSCTENLRKYFEECDKHADQKCESLMS